MRMKIQFSKCTEKVNITSVMPEYMPQDDIMVDDDYMRKLKEIVFHKLSETDRRILLLYAELQSQRKVGVALGVSASTVNIKLNEIRQKIKELL